MSNGTSANGMPKESTTWLITSERLGLRPMAKMIRAGIMVMRRRKNSGICRLMNPCMTTCPLRVPTEELDSPEASRARVHVRNRSDKRRPEKGQELANPPPVTLQRFVRSPRSRTLPRQHSLNTSDHLVSSSTHEIYSGLQRR